MMPPIQRSRIVETTAKVDVKKSSVTAQEPHARAMAIGHAPTPLPGVLTILHGELLLSKATLLEIFKRSGRLGAYLNNPELFMETGRGSIIQRGQTRVKKQIETSAILPVMPVSIIGTCYDEKNNFAPHGQIGTVTSEPPVIYTSVIHEHKTAENILKTRRFSVNIPSADLLEKVCICGNLSGADADKSSLFETFDADGVPMIQDCAISFACEVIQHIEMGGFDVFLARVTETYANEACPQDGWPVPRLVNPLLCSIDGKFWTMGEEQTPPPRCQSCGLPFDVDHKEFVAKEKDGSDSAYCTFCYEGGEFLEPSATVADMVEMGVPHLARKIGEEAARSELSLLVPTLARWLKDAQSL